MTVSIKLMHSFEVNIRICQPENSGVHRGEAWHGIISLPDATSYVNIV